MERQTVSLILVMLPLLFLSFITVSRQCLDDQRSLLLQFKNNLSFSPIAFFSTFLYSYEINFGKFKPISFSPSSRLSSWNSSSDCCSWDGVTCDEISGNVIGLDLFNQSISGGFDNSSALFQLQHLQTFNLAFNPFNSVPIPSGMDRLSKLTNLNLSSSRFTGQVPIEISQMKGLVLLDLSGNDQLKLEKPNLKELVGDISSLRVLVLDRVNISMHGSEWCQAVSALPKLQVLNLQSCYLTGPFDPTLSNLKFLMELRLGGNNFFSQVPEFFGSFSNLTVLSLVGCGLSGKFPEKVFQTRSLKSIYLSGNSLLQGSLPEFPQNGSLVNLILARTSFSGSLPFSIGNLRFLSYLDLSFCGIFGFGFNGPFPFSMSNLSQLRSLDLSKNNFIGSIPDFGLSANLSEIDLSSNQLNGSISSSHWDKLLKLEILHLGNNSLTGMVPSTLFSLPLLEKLDLSQNKFTQLSEFFNGSTLVLRDLDLSRNTLGGDIPSMIYGLPNLESLDLSWNNLGANLDMFQKLEHLSDLDLSGNNLTMKMNNTSSWVSQLQTLGLSSCNLKAIPDFLRNQSNLQLLDISNNQIYGEIPNWIFNNSPRLQLNLSHNFVNDVKVNLTGSIYIIDLNSNLLQGSVSRLPLSVDSYLDYSRNNFTSIIPSNIGSYLSTTIFLSFSSNSLIGDIPPSICDAGNLQFLDLSNNSLSGRIPLCFGSMKSLMILKLKGNYFHSIIPNTFLSGCDLRTLDLNGNKIEGVMPRSLESCTSLEVLDLGNNQMNDIFPSWLRNLSQLRVIIMRSNNFHGCIGQLDNSATFPLLQIIDLSSNNFSCNLPTEYILGWKAMKFSKEESPKNDQILGSDLNGARYYQDTVTVTMKGRDMELVKILTIYTSIDFSNNNFEGGIPAEIGDLVLLKILNLSRNALIGPIPSSFGNLKQLESLDLSRNKLNGEIPTSLLDLTFLGTLRLAFNQLTGMIPTGRQFQTFSEDSFEGNEGLCGFPLLKKCKNDVHENPSPNLNSEDDKEPNWEMIIAALGYGIGNGLAICMIVFWKPLNRRYQRLQFGRGR